jgi:hypothetical protein
MAVTEYQEVSKPISTPLSEARLTRPSESTLSSAKFPGEKSHPTPAFQKLSRRLLEQSVVRCDEILSHQKSHVIESFVLMV